MDGLIDLVKGVPKAVILLGDFNLPDVNWSTGETSRRARDFVDAVDDAMMEQLVDFSTQVRGNTLDLILTNIPERVLEVVEQGRLANSDHDMISFKISCGIYRPGAKEVKNWRRAD